VLIEWPSAHRALPQTESTSRFVRRCIDGAALKSPLWKSGRSSPQAQGAAAVLNEAGYAEQPASACRRRVDAFLCAAVATMASSS